MEHLEAALSFWKTHNFQMIGCFSAASNITGSLFIIELIRFIYAFTFE